MELEGTVNRSQECKDFKEGRRFRAIELLQEGWKQCRIAEALGVTQAAVSQWIRRFRQEGLDSLRRQPLPGPTPRLSEEQKQQLDVLLRQGAKSHGYTDAVWTCRRIAEVIEKHFGVSYHPTHVSRILHGMHWSPQKPVERASQRDEAAIAQWRADWPRLKRGH